MKVMFLVVQPSSVKWFRTAKPLPEQFSTRQLMSVTLVAPSSISQALFRLPGFPPARSLKEFFAVHRMKTMSEAPPVLPSPEALKASLCQCVMVTSWACALVTPRPKVRPTNALVMLTFWMRSWRALSESMARGL